MLLVLVVLVEVGCAGFTETSGCTVRMACVVGVADVVGAGGVAGVVGCGVCWCSPNKPMMNATIVAKILKITSLSSLLSSLVWPSYGVSIR